MTAGKERRALDKAVTSWRRVVAGKRQSIREPLEPAPAARPEEETLGEAHTSPQ